MKVKVFSQILNLSMQYEQSIAVALLGEDQTLSELLDSVCSQMDYLNDSQARRPSSQLAGHQCAGQLRFFGWS